MTRRFGKLAKSMMTVVLALVLAVSGLSIAVSGATGNARVGNNATINRQVGLIVWTASSGGSDTGGRINPGTVVHVYQLQNGRARIRHNNNNQRWINASYLRAATVTNHTGWVNTQSQPLIMRSSPRTDGVDTGVRVPRHATVRVIAEANGFARVEWNGRTGWVTLRYISRGNPPQNCTSHTWNNRGVCNRCGFEYRLNIRTGSVSTRWTTSNAPVRSRPYGGYATLSTIPAGQPVQVNAWTVNAFGNHWYRRTDGRWIYGGNLTTRAPQQCAHTWNNRGFCSRCNVEYQLNVRTGATETRWTTRNTPVRSRPYAGDATLYTLPAGRAVQVNAYARNAHGSTWYRRTDGRWIYVGNVTRTAPAGGGANVSPPAQTSSFRWPLNNAVATNHNGNSTNLGRNGGGNWGRRSGNAQRRHTDGTFFIHVGQDIRPSTHATSARAVGQQVLAPANGQIVAQGNQDSVDQNRNDQNRWMLIRHDCGLYSFFDHMQNTIANGRVTQGARIGEIGSGGHLHFAFASNVRNYRQLPGWNIMSGTGHFTGHRVEANRVNNGVIIYNPWYIINNGRRPAR